MTRTSLASAVAASALLLGSAATAQQISGGSQGGAGSRDVNASTYGAGRTNPDGTQIGISGGGEANAVNGAASTQSDAKLNERRAMQRSVATAQDEDERARSRTRTVVRAGEDVRSRTTSMYKQDGSRPVRETVVTRDGETTVRTNGPKPK